MSLAGKGFAPLRLKARMVPAGDRRISEGVPDFVSLEDQNADGERR
jgi:hypothetical protein